MMAFNAVFSFFQIDQQGIEKAGSAGKECLSIEVTGPFPEILKFLHIPYDQSFSGHFLVRLEVDQFKIPSLGKDTQNIGRMYRVLGVG
jgi:hypothetical protein